MVSGVFLEQHIKLGLALRVYVGQDDVNAGSERKLTIKGGCHATSARFVSINRHHR